MEKFGKNLEVLLEQNPAKDEDQENPAKDGRDHPALAAEDDQNVVVNQVEETMNNTTRLNRKRPLFSQTCNTLLEDEEPQGEPKENANRNGYKSPIAGKTLFFKRSQSDALQEKTFFVVVHHLLQIAQLS